MPHTAFIKAFASRMAPLRGSFFISSSVRFVHEKEIFVLCVQAPTHGNLFFMSELMYKSRVQLPKTVDTYPCQVVHFYRKETAWDAGATGTLS